MPIIDVVPKLECILRLERTTTKRVLVLTSNKPGYVCAAGLSCLLKVAWWRKTTRAICLVAVSLSTSSVVMYSQCDLYILKVVHPFLEADHTAGIKVV